MTLYKRLVRIKVANQIKLILPILILIVLFIVTGFYIGKKEEVKSEYESALNNNDLIYENIDKENISLREINKEKLSRIFLLTKDSGYALMEITDNTVYFEFKESDIKKAKNLERILDENSFISTLISGVGSDEWDNLRMEVNL